MNVLERSLAELSIQIERLQASNQDLERKLDAMRTRERASPKRLLLTDPNPEDQGSGSNVIGRPRAPESPEAASA
jgi:hypothetical protein